MKHRSRPQHKRAVALAVCRKEMDAAARANLRARLDLTFVILTILAAIAAFAHRIF
jgi:hypothetical protein